MPLLWARAEHWAPLGCVLTQKVSVYSSDSKMANTLPAHATAPSSNPGQKSLSAELLPRRDARLHLHTALCMATKGAVGPEDENDLPSLISTLPKNSLTYMRTLCRIRKRPPSTPVGLRYPFFPWMQPPCCQGIGLSKC